MTTTRGLIGCAHYASRRACQLETPRTRACPRCCTPRWSGAWKPDGHRGQSSKPPHESGTEQGKTPTSSTSETNLGQIISVLVVEDDAGVRETTADLLREEGYAVTTASDGVEGMRHLVDESFGVVLLDMRLPRLNGPAILDALDAPPPVVIFSAMEYFKETELRERFGSKVFAFLRKPAAPSHLLAVVADAARGYPAPD